MGEWTPKSDENVGRSDGLQAVAYIGRNHRAAERESANGAALHCAPGRQTRAQIKGHTAAVDVAVVAIVADGGVAAAVSGALGGERLDGLRGGGRRGREENRIVRKESQIAGAWTKRDREETQNET